MKTRLLLPALFILSAAVSFAATPDKDVVVHEWGTFTSVQGSDGVQMHWNPLIAPELPQFVYDRTRPRPGKVSGIIVAGKTGITCRQRMETPVIYFYSAQPHTFDVTVRFPTGTITEWYPQESAATGTTFTGVESDRPVLRWLNLKVLPLEESARINLPSDPSGSHYYAARETDSSLLRTVDEDKTETEKFLFYRGVASFQAPLTVRLDSTDSRQIILTNNGVEEIEDLFVYEVQAKGGMWLEQKHLRAGETRTVNLEPGPDVRSMTAADSSLEEARRISPMRLNTSLVDALARAGLYQREATAMVKTWENAWFAENGLRVLYVLPRSFTDRTLPLTITPTPNKIERVMVARAEIITPEMEAALLREVERYIAAKPEDRPKVVDETRALGFGRFTESIFRRITATGTRSREFSTLSWELLQAVAKPEIKTAAAK